MLTRFHVENFRCLREVDVPLRPLTVLIGPNDSGKSAFLDAVFQHFEHNPQLSPDDFWRRETQSILLRGDFAGGGFRSYRFEKGEPPICGGITKDIGTARRFQLPSTGVAMECEGFADDSGLQFDIDTSGARIPALVDYLLRRDRKRFFQFVESMKSLILGLDDVDVATPNPKQRRIDLVIENGFRIPANAASVGVRLMLFFVALAQHPTPPSLILVEEPENGVHPKRLADVMRLLREITQGKHGQNPAQVILTTHSPDLLDHVDVEQDQVLVFRRNNDGSRSAEPVDQERLRGFLDEFMLGEVWYNRGEEGLVAKKP